MADLAAVVTVGRGRAPLMPSVPTLIANLDGERVRLAPQTPVGQYTPLRPSSLTEGLSVIANTVTRTWNHTGDVAFNASPDHTTLVTSYEGRLRVSGSSTVVATLNLGKPAPDGNGVIVASLTSLFGGQAAGNYTVSIAAIGPDGTTDSAESNVFTLPVV